MGVDYCTFFPEKWINYNGKKVDISKYCKQHDVRCGSHGFYKDLWNARIVGAVAIATVASVACWVKYPSNMWRKLWG